MALLIDSGFLYATLDKSDENHQRAIGVLSNLVKEILILPTPVLVEVTYLLHARLGHNQMRQFIAKLKDSPLQFEAIKEAEILP